MTPFFAKVTGAGMLALITLSGCVVVEEGGPPYLPPPERPDVCPMIYAPVCGARGGERRTLSNQCIAESRGYRVIHDGECRRGAPISPGRPQVCTREFDPVCARRGSETRTFGNACSARAEGFAIIRDGGC